MGASAGEWGGVSNEEDGVSTGGAGRPGVGSE